jgi:hypothetical protein
MSSSASAHLVGDLAHRAAPDARTLRAAGPAAAIATNIVALSAAPGRQTVVRRLREVISLTAQVQEQDAELPRTRSTTPRTS